MLNGQVYNVTGPEASSPHEQIAVLSELLGRRITAQEVSMDQAEASMVGLGLPEWDAECLGELFGFYAEGLGEQVSHDVEKVTGHRPRDYRQFATDYRQAFAG